MVIIIRMQIGRPRLYTNTEDISCTTFILKLYLMKNLPALLLCIVLLSIFGCKDKRTPDVAPNVLFFLITENGNRLPDSTLDNISLYYYENGKKISSPPSNLDDKKLVYPASRFSGDLAGKGVLAGNYVDWLVYGKNVNDFYLEYPNGDVDTMYVEVTFIGREEGAKDRCYCAYPFTVVKFNGKDAPESVDPKSATGKPIYVFEKNL